MPQPQEPGQGWDKLMESDELPSAMSILPKNVGGGDTKNENISKEMPRMPHDRFVYGGRVKGRGGLKKNCRKGIFTRTHFQYI